MVLEVSMVQYLKNIITEFPDAIQGKSAMPAQYKLFVIRDDCEAMKLGDKRALAFHHMVAQLLFLVTKAR